MVHRYLLLTALIASWPDRSVDASCGWGFSILTEQVVQARNSVSQFNRDPSQESKEVLSSLRLLASTDRANATSLVDSYLMGAFRRASDQLVAKEHAAGARRADLESILDFAFSEAIRVARDKKNFNPLDGIMRMIDRSYEDSDARIYLDLFRRRYHSPESTEFYQEDLQTLRTAATSGSHLGYFGNVFELLHKARPRG